MPNNFLQFDERRKNIASDEHYLDSPERAAGANPHGEISGAVLNKTLLQTSLMTSALAQFLEAAGYPVSDSDSPAKIAEAFASAVKGASPKGKK